MAADRTSYCTVLSPQEPQAGMHLGVCMVGTTVGTGDTFNITTLYPGVNTALFAVLRGGSGTQCDPVALICTGTRIECTRTARDNIGSSMLFTVGLAE